MMENGPRVFLSYTLEDRQAVERIYEKLVRAGVIAWMDITNISPGKWEPQIKKAIRESDFVLIFLSNHSINKRGFLQREIKWALEVAAGRLESDVYLIPVRLENCVVPEYLLESQCIDLFKRDAWQSLVKIIKLGVHRKGEVGSHPKTSKSLGNKEVKVGLGIAFSHLKEIIEKEKPKSYLFVAMPFSKEMEDRYYYGIQRAADNNGFACKRIDKDSFTGDILQRIKAGIETSSAVVADLTSANPNVYLEVGLAWGKEVPTILLIEENQDLCFDVRGQRCLMYNSIRKLEEVLGKELEELKLKGLI